MSRQQRTLKTAVEFEGIGLHSGEKVKVRVLPAPVDNGIELQRVDLEDAQPIPANIRFYSEKERRSRLQHGPIYVDTVEHLLATCGGLNVDNVIIEISGEEMPGMDGSASEYVEMFKQAGFVEQRAEARIFKLNKPIYVHHGEATLVALPADQDGLTLQYIASFDEPGVSGGSISYTLSPEVFEKELAPARTFCLASEVEALQASGLGKGATRENTVVLGDPDTEMRLEDEPIRHKMLDLVGDLQLLGAGLQAHIIATRSGHRTNAELVRKLLDLMQEEETGGVITRESGMDIREIMRMLPHRYPFVMIDRVIEIDGYKKAVAIKNVSINEPYFQGHFPDQPLMPGVLQLESMAQLAGVLLLRKLENTGKLAVLWAIDRVKLRGAVSPGDQLRIEVETQKMKGKIARVKGTGFVSGKIVCEATLTFTMVDV